MQLKNKTVTIVGFNRSGQEAARLLNNLGAKVKISDCADSPKLRSDFKKLNLGNALNEFGKHSEKFITESDLIILSPGVRFNSDPVNWARAKNIPAISEIELAYQLCPAPIVAVTGTNGKTTVTTLIGEILKLSKKRTFVCGNIGTPFSKYVLEIKPDDLVVLEISSFQLETIDKFRPHIAVFLNFSQNHLDRHKDLEEYLAAKKRIFLNQTTGDFAVLNYSDAVVKGLAKEIKSQPVFFNHNEEAKITNPNYLAALAVGGIFRIDKEKSLKLLQDFKGVEHRLEFVKNIRGVDFINDSKATTVDSVIWALSNISKPVIMIAGGRNKGLDFTPVRNLVKGRIKEMVLIGEAKEKIRDAFSGAVKIQDAATLESAVRLAFKEAQKGDCVLLCPMCASFDMFRDFEERGRIFKEIVQRLEA